jgi:hypothetical protein
LQVSHASHAHASDTLRNAPPVPSGPLASRRPPERSEAARALTFVLTVVFGLMAGALVAWWFAHR